MTRKSLPQHGLTQHFRADALDLPDGAPVTALPNLAQPWYCVECGQERPPNPGIECPRPGCRMRSYGSHPPAEPRLPPPPDERAGDR